jgi:hypothetical protein
LGSVKETITKEYLKCAQDPSYFLRKYVYITHQKHGKILFKPYEFQKRTLKEITSYRFNVILKARQMGISTLVAAHALHLMLFNEEKNVLVVSYKQDVAKNIVSKVKTMHNNLPSWMREKKLEDNQLSLKFGNGSRIWAEATGPNAGRSESISLLIIDEAAFIDGVEELWSAAKLTLDVGEGHAIVISTPAGVGNWYHKTWSRALDGSHKVNTSPDVWEGTGTNDFHPIKLHWKLHPDRGEEWRAEQDRTLGKKKARRECDTDFTTSGDQVVHMDVIQWYEEHGVQLPENYHMYKGSKDVHIWEEPNPNKSYIIAADVARGDSKDFSAFHVYSVVDMEQVVEFKSKVPPTDFGDVLVAYGTMYNDALMVVERNGYGWSTLQRVIDRGYKNLLYTSNDLKLIEVSKNQLDLNSSKLKPGLDTNSNTRQLMITKMVEFFEKRWIRVRSERLIEELKTFIWKQRGTRQKAEHMNGFNDDLILATCFAVWVRDTAIKYQSQLRNVNKSALKNFKGTNMVYSSKEQNEDPYRYQAGKEIINLRELL